MHQPAACILLSPSQLPQRIKNAPTNFELHVGTKSACVQSHDNIAECFEPTLTLQIVLIMAAQIEQDFDQEMVFDSVRDIRRFVANETPDKPPITVNMLVLRNVNFSHGTHLTLVNKGFAHQWGEIAESLLNMEHHQRAPYVFRLTVWRTEEACNYSPPARFAQGTEVQAKHVTHVNIFRNRASGHTERIYGRPIVLTSMT